jgi:hypothetical protein
MNQDTLKISQKPDGSYFLEWDPNDPNWCFLNNLTSKEIEIFIQNAIKEHKNDN